MNIRKFLNVQKLQQTKDRKKENVLSSFLSFIMTVNSAALLYVLTAALAYLECAAFVGLLVPGESFVSLAGFLASQGLLKLEVLFPLVIISAVLGDITGYFVGRKLGEPFLTTSHRFLRIPESLVQSAKQFFQRHGGKTMLVARFIGFLRSLAPFLAGAAKANFLEFLIFDILGAGLWATTFLLIGYFLGESYKVVEKYINRGGLFLILLIIGIWAAVTFIRRYKVSFEALKFLLKKDFIFSAWFLSSASLLFLLSVDVKEHKTMALDVYILKFIHSYSNPVLDVVMSLITLAGSLFFVVPVVLITGYIFYKQGKKFDALLFSGAVITTITLSYILNFLFHRDRPQLFADVENFFTYSFPSGHVVASSVTFWFIAWIILRESKGYWKISSVVIALIPLLVGFSRVYLGVHWPTDIFGGHTLSLAALAPWIYLYEARRGEEWKAKEKLK